MVQYGFRLFTVERKNGDGNTSKPFVDPDFGDFADHLHQAYEQAIGRKLHENPHDGIDDDGNPKPLDPNSSIVRLDWVRRNGTRIFFGLSSGKNDGFADAMSAADGEPDVSLRHLAPRRERRGVFILPPTEIEGVLAFEAVARSCPTPILTRWTNVWSKAQQDSAGTRHSRIALNQMTDDQQVKALLAQGDPQEIVLTERRAQGNGLPDRIEYKLQAPVWQAQKNAVQDLARKWARRDKKTSMADGVNEAKALIGPQIQDVDFDDCYIAVKHERQTKHVRPDDYNELFTYDNGDTQRDTDSFFQQVNEKLVTLGLAQSMGLDLSGWPRGLPGLRANE